MKDLTENKVLLKDFEKKMERAEKTAQNITQLTHLEHTIMYYYPLFEEHYYELILYKIMEKQKNGTLKWLCDTQSLVIYFDEIKPAKLKKHKWNEIQELFSITRNLSDVRYQIKSNANNNYYLHRIKPILSLNKQFNTKT